MLFQSILAWFRMLKDREEGQTLVEYALIIVLIAIVVILALVFLGGNISDILSSIGSVLAEYPVE